MDSTVAGGSPVVQTSARHRCVGECFSAMLVRARIKYASGNAARGERGAEN